MADCPRKEVCGSMCWKYDNEEVYEECKKEALEGVQNG